MNRLAGGTCFGFLIATITALAGCTVGKDGTQGAPGVPCNGCVTAASLAPGAVTSTAIGDGAIKTPQLAAQSVTSGIIADGAVGTTHLAAASVTSAGIADGAILNNHLGSAVVSGGNIAAGTIAGSNIGAGAVGGLQLANGAVTNAKIAPATIIEANMDLPMVGAVASTTDETVMARFLGDLNALTNMRVLIVVNGGTGRGGPSGGAGTLTVTCSSATPTTVYTVALEGSGGSPWTHISPSFTCAQAGFLDVKVRATAASSPVVIRQLEILHGH